MNTDISPACVCYGLYDEETIVAFMGVLHQPCAKNFKIKRVSRLVVLPDYQGIGIGFRFLNAIGDIYKAQGFDFTIVTSAKNLIQRLYRSNEWIMRELTVSKCNNPSSKIDFGRVSMRTNNKTGRFIYRGNDENASRTGERDTRTSGTARSIV